MFESFRYHQSFSEAQRTLKSIYSVLKPGGIFLCDIVVSQISMRSKSNKLKIHDEMRMGNGKLIVKDELMYARGNFDVRFDHVKVFKRRLLGKSNLVMEKDIKRCPFLRISENKMREMQKKAGFLNMKVIPGFAYSPYPRYSTLFSGQKGKSS